MIDGGPDIRVMSFNILTARSGQNDSRWRRRKESVALAIWAFGPDLLGAQEVKRFQAHYLHEELREYVLVSAGRDEGLFAGECVAIFYRADRFEKLDEGHFWLSNRPDEPGSRNWGTVTPRLVSWAKLRDRRHRTNGSLFFFNTHFDPFSRWARFRSAAMLRQRILGIAGTCPAILTGDFNASAGRRLYETVLGEPGNGSLQLFDAYRAVHPVKQRNEGTWHGRGIRIPRRIDWILHTRHFAVVDAYIDHRKRSGRYPSDHFPVTATLRW
jgi:endonuclease/exonuclease/phosphatase family metal-dependent hydrolase